MYYKAIDDIEESPLIQTNEQIGAETDLRGQLRFNESGDRINVMKYRKCT